MEKAKDDRDRNVNDVCRTTTKKTHSLDNLGEDVPCPHKAPAIITVLRGPWLRCLVEEIEVKRIRHKA